MCQDKQTEENVVEPVQRVYVGETSRTLYHSTNQHKKEYKKAIKSWQSGADRRTETQD